MPTFNQIRNAIEQDKRVMLLEERTVLELNLEKIKKIKDPTKKRNDLDVYADYQRAFLLAPIKPSYDTVQLQKYLDELFPQPFSPDKATDFKSENGVFQCGFMTYRSRIGRIERRFVAEEDSLKESGGFTDGHATLSEFTVSGATHVVLYPSEALGRDILSGKLTYGKPGILTFVKLDDLERYKGK